MQVIDNATIKELQLKKRPVLLQFYTQWCPPCKLANKIIQNQILNHPNSFILGRINTDQAEELVLDYKIEGVPTIILLNSDGKVGQKIVGLDQTKIKSLFRRIKKQE